MCTTVSSPTPKDPVKKDPIYLRNPFLDGLGIGAENSGRNSLRIDPGSPVPLPGGQIHYNPTVPPGTYMGGGGFDPATHRAPGSNLGRNSLGINVS